MKTIILVLIILIFASINERAYSLNQTAYSLNTDKETLDKLLQDYYEDNLKLWPVSTANMFGDYRYNDYWPNYLSDDVIKQINDYFTKYNNELTKINRNNLTAADKINYDVLAWECEVGMESMNFKHDFYMPINQMFSQHLFVPQMANGSGVQPFTTVKQYEDWLKRMDDYLDWCKSCITNMRAGMSLGYTLPAILVERVIPQFESFTTGTAEDHEFYAPIKNLPADFGTDDKNRLTGEYKKMITEKLIPTYLSIISFLKDEYLPNARTTAGVSDTPNGKDYYAFCIKLNTTTDMAADEIYSLGEKEVERIKNEMESVKQQAGFNGTLNEFFEHVKNKKELMPYSAPEEVLIGFNEIHDRMKPALNKLFTKEPAMKLEIKRTPAFVESTASPYYVAGSVDGNRPGTFYVPIPDAKKYNIYADEVLFLHEAIPGHHYQGSWQLNDSTLPDIRQIVWYVGMGEGWALYTESLGKELGLYTDIYQYFGMLSLDMLRATRLVIDVGLHVKGWTREQAIEYMKDLVPMSDQVIESSIERYMAVPGQALGYKIGQIKILELRKKAEIELGSKFNIAEFHEQVLSTGSVPLRILETKINNWIETKK